MLVAQGVCGALALGTSGTTQAWVVAGFFAAFFALVAVVAFRAFNRPGQLMGRDETAEKIYYQWKGRRLADPNRQYEGFGEMTFGARLDSGEGTFFDADASDWSEQAAFPPQRPAERAASQRPASDLERREAGQRRLNQAPVQLAEPAVKY